MEQINRNSCWSVVGGGYTISDGLGSSFDGYSPSKSMRELSITIQTANSVVKKLNRHEYLMSFVDFVAAGNLSKEDYVNAAKRIKLVFDKDQHGQ
jgi:hypothetical protein